MTLADYSRIPGLSEVDVGDLAQLAWFVEDDTARIDTPIEAVRYLCTLQKIVTEAGVIGEFPSIPLDCFCRRSTALPEFRNNGDAVRFIVLATLDRLVRDTGTVVEPMRNGRVTLTRQPFTEADTALYSALLRIAFSARNRLDEEDRLMLTAAISRLMIADYGIPDDETAGEIANLAETMSRIGAL